MTLVLGYEGLVGRRTRNCTRRALSFCRGVWSLVRHQLHRRRV